MGHMTLLSLLESIDGSPMAVRDFCRGSGLFETAIDPKIALLTISLSHTGRRRLTALRQRKAQPASQVERDPTPEQLARDINRAVVNHQATQLHKEKMASRRQAQATEVMTPVEQRSKQQPVWNGRWVWPHEAGYARIAQAQFDRAMRQAVPKPVSPAKRQGPFLMPSWP